ncbi:hypothetical protein D3C72_749200 [compost metagenome]
MQDPDDLARGQQRLTVIGVVLVADMVADDVRARLADEMALAAPQGPALVRPKGVAVAVMLAPGRDRHQQIARVVVGVEHARQPGQDARHEGVDDLGQFGLGAGRLHPVSHAAQKFDHLAPFAQHLAAGQKLVVDPFQLAFAAPLIG